MNLLDTVVLVGTVNPKNRHHKKAIEHLDKLVSEPDTRIPTSTVLEFDLLLKAREYSNDERNLTWLELAARIPSVKILPPTATSMASAAKLEEQGMDYFDALITALAIESNSKIVTDDSEIARKAHTFW